MTRFVMVMIAQLGITWIIVVDTGSYWLGTVLMVMMAIQYDQMRRNRAMSIVLKKVYIDQKYGQKGMNT